MARHRRAEALPRGEAAMGKINMPGNDAAFPYKSAENYKLLFEKRMKIIFLIQGCSNQEFCTGRQQNIVSKQ